MSECLRLPFSGRVYPSLARVATHPGLWFDRFLNRQIVSGQSPSLNQHPFIQLIDQTCAIGEPPLYRQAFGRWINVLDAMGVRPRVARALFRLAVGHGGESVIETGMTLHHTYGVPYIPGSSLKGTAASFADRELTGLWAAGGNAHHTLFGTTDSAAYVDFLDALPLPGKWHLQRDVLTVHHPKYYRGEPVAPADWDDPTPIYFLTAVGEFLIALHPSTGAEAWAEAGYGVLKMALEDEGVGGKTSSGYGRLRMVAPLPRVDVGATFRTMIENIGRTKVTLAFQDPYVLGVPHYKDLDLHIPNSLVGNRIFEAGQKVNIVVVSIDEDEYDFVVECRPQTKEERRGE